MLQLTHVMRVVLTRLPIAVIKMMYTHNEIQRMRQSRSPKFTAIYSRKWQIIGILWQALVNIHTGRSRYSRSSPSHTENNSKAIENAQHQAMPRQNQDHRLLDMLTHQTGHSHRATLNLTYHK